MGRFKKVILSVVLAVFALCLVGCAKGNDSSKGDLSDGSSTPQQSVENKDESSDNPSSENSSDSETSSPDWTPWVPID